MSNQIDRSKCVSCKATDFSQCIACLEPKDRTSTKYKSQRNEALFLAGVKKAGDIPVVDKVQKKRIERSQYCNPGY